jgi:uncharacterized protein (UPF0335 family)
MSTLGNVDAEKLIKFIERIERLESEKKAIADDIKDVYGELKSTGYDAKITKLVIKLRAMDTSERDEMEYLADVYKKAVGLE